MVPGAAEEFTQGPFARSRGPEEQNRLEWLGVAGQCGIVFHEAKIKEISISMQDL